MTPTQRGAAPRRDRALRRATYRLQMHAGFTFGDAAAVAAYLAELGISHIYLSPVLQAAKGSTHGYDVVDPSAVNEELGGEEGHARLQAALGEAGLGQVLDIVPNHMAVSTSDNRWWWDVLENGPSSAYADYFDVDWGEPAPGTGSALSGYVVLLPVLGDHYGRELEAGRFCLVNAEGSFRVRYFDHEYPIAPRSLDQLVSRAARRLPRGFDRAARAEVESIGTALGRLPPSWATDRASVRERHRDKEVLRARLAALCAEHPEVQVALDAETEAVNADHDALDAVLQRQNYRLAFWRTASEQGQYRRFFDINDLVGIRVEDAAVFADSHRLVLEWLHSGVIDGLRVDHIDGLRDPLAYLCRLEEAGTGVWALVEKILEEGEELPDDWPVAGTTGYDWLNIVGGLLVDTSGAQRLAEVFAEFTGSDQSWEELVHECKMQVLNGALSTDLNRLVERLAHVCEHHRRHSDHTRRELRECLAEVISSYGVYRTYVVPGKAASGSDVAVVQRAVLEAGLRRPELDGELLGFVRQLLLMELAAPSATAAREQSELAMRTQQLTGPVMAKAVEDTAFYRYMPLLSLNEVGGGPHSAAVGPAQFHSWCATTHKRRPFTLLALSTHDTKRSEDVRARLSVLSEIPNEWAQTVHGWHQMNRRHRVADLPDPATEWMFYQTVVGAWPISADRVLAFLEKAMREAKVHTSWDQQNPIYEGAVQHFAAAVLRSRKFLAEVEALAGDIAGPGRSNSLALKLLTLTAPGVADLYQGTELWDLSLVDPDNRRPVDYGVRRSLLEKSAGVDLGELWSAGDVEGLSKLTMVHRALELRRRRPACFGDGEEGSYEPLEATGPSSEHCLAFGRGGQVVTAVTVLPLGLARAGGWRATTVRLPKGRWRDVLSGKDWSDKVDIGQLLGPFPVALLEKLN
ncbi:MAG TPA: malto-oligosyltrehalose synthase [Acidimicrobiales bacterium]|nr:malto-oligosyltrehalose synthase [Acidimicrobiales bacterium]